VVPAQRKAGVGWPDGYWKEPHAHRETARFHHAARRHGDGVAVSPIATIQNSSGLIWEYRHNREDNMHKTIRRTLGLPGFALVLTASAVNAQDTVRVRGTIDRVEGPVYIVKSRDGSELKVSLADNGGVTAIVKASLSDIKQGSFVGVAGMPQADGSQKAIEVLIFPEAMRGTGEGHYPWDVRPQSTIVPPMSAMNLRRFN
jgi:hypothetical protein